MCKANLLAASLRFPNFKQRSNTSVWIREWNSHFGVSLEVLVVVLTSLRTSALLFDPHYPAFNLLMTMFFLKTYGTEDVCSKTTGVDRKTWRKAVWKTVTDLDAVCSWVLLQSEFDRRGSARLIYKFLL